MRWPAMQKLRVSPCQDMRAGTPGHPGVRVQPSHNAVPVQPQFLTNAVVITQSITTSVQDTDEETGYTYWVPEVRAARYEMSTTAADHGQRDLSGAGGVQVDAMQPYAQWYQAMGWQRSDAGIEAPEATTTATTASAAADPTHRTRHGEGGCNKTRPTSTRATAPEVTGTPAGAARPSACTECQRRSGAQQCWRCSKSMCTDCATAEISFNEFQVHTCKACRHRETPATHVEAGR